MIRAGGDGGARARGVGALTRWAVTLALFAALSATASATCFASAKTESDWVSLLGNAIPSAGSCCQKDVCNIPCPATFPKVSKS